MNISNNKLRTKVEVIKWSKKFSLIYFGINYYSITINVLFQFLVTIDSQCVKSKK